MVSPLRTAVQLLFPLFTAGHALDGTVKVALSELLVVEDTFRDGRANPIVMEGGLLHGK